MDIGAMWRDRRRRPLLLALAMLMIAIVVGVLLARSAAGGFEVGASLPAAGAETPAGPAGPVPPPVGRSVPVPPPSPPVAARPSAEPAEVMDEDAERIAGAIERATRRALRRGEAVEWRKAGASGYVTVSEPVDYPDRTCRSVVATVTAEDGDARSSTHVWCQDEDEDWEPTR